MSKEEDLLPNDLQPNDLMMAIGILNGKRVYESKPRFCYYGRTYN